VIRIRQESIDVYFKMCIIRHMKALEDYLRITGMTQAELAKRAEMSQANLNHFMKGRREPRIKNLRRLSKATGISIEKLVEGL